MNSTERRIQEVEEALDNVSVADAARCRKDLHALRRRLSRGKPSDRVLAGIFEQVEESIRRVNSRREGAPRPVFDPALPITAHQEEILRAVHDSQVVIIAGETGSGKTTQLPKYCLQAGRGLRGLIGCTQPRRIAASAMAQRVAEE